MRERQGVALLNKRCSLDLGNDFFQKDPASLFEQISAIEEKYKTDTKQTGDEDSIAVLLDVAPSVTATPSKTGKW
jgi:hypothetical protein